jgi:hypothetical protein
MSERTLTAMPKRTASALAASHASTGAARWQATPDGTTRFSDRHAKHFTRGFYRTGPVELTLSSIGIGTYLGEDDDTSDAAYIEAVRDALAAGAPLAAPYFRARRGHPVAISARFFTDLVRLEGDEGARKLLAANEQSIVRIPVGDPGVIRDIDRPEDLAPPLRI